MSKEHKSNALPRRVLELWERVDWEGWWGDFLDARFELAARLGEFHGKRVLDIGCGPGIFLAEMEETNNKIGVDYDLARLKKACEICSDGTFIRGDLLKLPFREESFDIVILGGILEMIVQKEAFLKQIFPLCKSGGKILATTPNRDYWAYHGESSRIASLAELQHAFSIFEKVQVGGYNPLPSVLFFLPLSWQARIPLRWARFFSFPSRLISRLPGIRAVWRFCMKKESLLTRSKSFLIIAEMIK